MTESENTYSISYIGLVSYQLGLRPTCDVQLLVDRVQLNNETLHDI